MGLTIQTLRYERKKERERERERDRERQQMARETCVHEPYIPL